jgi:hypothetical protein
LKRAGYTEFKKEGIVVEGWPVQFLPVADDLDAECLDRAVEVRFHDVTARTLRPEHIVATALKLGRPKDFARISQFLSENAVEIVALREVLDRHGMGAAWSRYCRRTGTTDPLERG